MAEIMITWEEAAAAVGVPAHGSYNLERALKDSATSRSNTTSTTSKRVATGYSISVSRNRRARGLWTGR